MALATRHRIVLVAVALAIVAALVAMCDREETTTAPPPAARETIVATPGPASTPRAPHRVVATARAESPVPAGSDESTVVDERLEADEDDGFPAIDVEVVQADGSPARHTRVYTLRSGAAGHDFIGDGPGAAVDAHGDAHLFVPRAGDYDIGAVLGPLHAMARDVAVPSAGRVRIVLPPVGDVMVVATPAVIARLVPDGRRQPINVTLASDDGAVPHAFPGRGESLAWTEPVRFAEGASESQVIFPAGAIASVTVTDEFAATPQTVRVPATVHVDLSHRYVVALTARLEPTDFVPATGGLLEVDLDPGAGGSPRGIYFRGALTAGTPARGVFAGQRVSPEVAASHGTIRWSGRGIATGSIDFDGLAADQQTPLEIVVRLDGTPLPTVPTPDQRVRSAPATRLRVTDPIGGKWPTRFFVAHANGGGMGSEVPADNVATIRVLDPAWIVATRGDDVAGPVRVAQSADTVNELTLRPGGYVFFLLDAAPPPGLGTLTIELADGGLLNAGGLVRRVDLRRRDELGPMLPGDYEFIVRLGDEEVARVNATVRAGDTRIGYRIPRLSAH